MPICVKKQQKKIQYLVQKLPPSPPKTTKEIVFSELTSESFSSESSDDEELIRLNE